MASTEPCAAQLNGHVLPAEEDLPHLPLPVCARLAPMSAAATGARRAAEAAVLVAQQMEDAWTNEFNTAMLAIGLDPTLDWRLDFRTGRLVEQPSGMAAQDLEPLLKPPP